MATENGHQRLLTLEAGRFLAAAGVMLFHYTSVVGDFTGRLPFNDVFRPGHVGVPYFFVLSGFIIYHIHRADIGQPATIGRFVMKRAIRLYPMFLAISLVMLAAFLLKPGLSGSRTLDVSGIAADFLLLPHSDAVLSISWTLRHEMVFYALFVVAIWLGPKALWLVGLWALISLGLSGTDWAKDLGKGSVVATTLNMGFVFGICAAAALHRLPTKRGGIWALAGGTAFVALCIVEWSMGRGVPHDIAVLGRAGDMAYLLAAAFLIYGLANLETRWVMPHAQLWKALGGSSYLLYLLHQPLASLALRLPGVANGLPVEILFTVLAAGAILLALVAHLTIERWLLRRLSVRVRRTPDRLAPAV